MTEITLPALAIQTVPLTNLTQIPMANIPRTPPTVATEITMANVGTNRVIVNPNDPTYVTGQNTYRGTFEPIQLRKRSGPLIIHGKRWYFRLVIGKNGDYKRSRALMDDYSLNQISHHMIVCFTPDTIPGRRELFRNKDGTPIRIYAFFDSYIEFYEYMSLFNPLEQAFYEIIFGELPQKPHFDIDVNQGDVNELYPGENIEIISEILRESVTLSCIEVMAEHMITLDLERDLLLYSSHGATKRSYHIVINNKCHDGNKEARAFYDAVMAKVNLITRGKYLAFIDKSVYSPRQQFRLVGCQKQGSGRPKVFNSEFWFRNVKYTHVYTEDITDPVRKNLTVIYESLISFTSGCSFLPSLIPPRVFNYNNLGALPDIDDNVVNLCLNMMREKIPSCPFSMREISGHLILLKREAPSCCPICKVTHEHEHPYIFIVGGKAYWDCRRSQPDTKKIFLGYLAMTIDEIQTGGALPGLFNTGEIQEETEEGGEFMFGDYNIGTPTLAPLKQSPPKETVTEVPQPTKEVTTNNPVFQNNNPTIIPDPTIANIPQTVMRAAKSWSQTKYLRRAPEDMLNVRSLDSTKDMLMWNPGAPTR